MAKSKFDINKPIKVNPKYDYLKDHKLVVESLTKYGGMSAGYFEVVIVYRKQTFKGIVYDINLVNDCVSKSSNFVKKSRAFKQIVNLIVGKYQKQQAKLEL